MAKQLVFAEEARRQLSRGMEILADAVATIAFTPLSLSILTAGILMEFASAYLTSSRPCHFPS